MFRRPLIRLFILWVKAGGKVIPHLVTRREAERALFLS
jgi:GH24 family phage-related lysozyme (muramidase)